MPGLGLGTWKSQPGEVGAAVRSAIELGYRHIDCAAIYANEAEVGEAIAAAIADGLVTRDELWITSKLWNNAHAPADVEPALRKTLADLRVEHLDLYLIHWPVALRAEVTLPASPTDLISLDELPLADTWTALEDCAAAGLARHIGVSNFSLTKVRALMTAARRAPELNQIELHPYLQQRELVEACRDLGVQVTAYSPLGSRDRPDSLRQADEPILLDDPTLAKIAARLECSVAQVLLAWALSRETSVLAKSVDRGRQAENLAAADIELDDEARAAIAELDRERRYLDGEIWCGEGSPYTLEDLWDEQTG